MSLARSRRLRAGSGARSTWQNTALAYLFMAPFLLLLITYHVIPIFFGTFLAFTKYNIISPPEWVGLANFRELATDSYFWSGLKNSLLYLIVVPVIQLLSIALALFVNQPLKGIGFFRTAYYVPVVTSFAVVGLIWGWMYQQGGPVSALLAWLHLTNSPTDLLDAPQTALWAVMFVTIWKGLGYYMVLYLAGLQGIGPELEEAAVIDGANRAQVFWNITLPGLRPTLLVCSLLSTISAIKVFDEIFIMTQGGPSGSTYTAVYFTYAKAFQDFRYGYAAAGGLVIALISLLFGVVNFRLTRGGRSDA